MSRQDADLVVVSSDAIRLEWYGDASDQTHSARVFDEVFRQSEAALKKGHSVVVDATNLSRKKRRHLLTRLPKDVHKAAHYVATPFEECVKRNAERKRPVPLNVLDRMYRSLHLPTFEEGWDSIEYVFPDDLPNESYLQIPLTILLDSDRMTTPEGMEWLAALVPEIHAIHGLPHDSPHHTFSVGLHTHHVFQTMRRLPASSEREHTVWKTAALLHDIGKAYCKRFENHKGDPTRYAHYYGHESVGAQLAVLLLKRLDCSHTFIYEVSALIQFHMVLLHATPSKPDRLIHTVGAERLDVLKQLRAADESAR